MNCWRRLCANVRLGSLWFCKMSCNILPSPSSLCTGCGMILLWGWIHPSCSGLSQTPRTFSPFSYYSDSYWEHPFSFSGSLEAAQVRAPGSRPPSANHLQSRVWGTSLTCENPELLQRCSPLHAHLLPHSQLVWGLQVAEKKSTHQTVAELWRAGHWLSRKYRWYLMMLNRWSKS